MSSCAASTDGVLIYDHARGATVWVGWVGIDCYSICAYWYKAGGQWERDDGQNLAGVIVGGAKVESEFASLCDGARGKEKQNKKGADS